jgi:hypothetical protein
VNDLLERSLAECTEEVLEQMFFVRPVEHLESGDLPAGLEISSHMIVEIHFEGEPSGHLRLSLSLQAARSIAADFLAEVQSLNLWNGNLTVAMSTESPLCPAAAASAS